MQTFAKSKINYLKSNSKKLIIFYSIYFLGFLLGLFFLGETNESSVIYVNAKNYYVTIFDFNSSLFSIFIKCFIAGFLLSLTTIIFALTKYTITLICIILFYRGVILGSASIIFFNLSGVSGVIIYIILTFPVHVIITSGLIVSSVLNCKFNCKQDIKIRLVLSIKNALISILFTLIASIYLLLLLIIAIRPINLLF